MNQVTKQKAIQLLANCHIAEAITKIQTIVSLPSNKVHYYNGVDSISGTLLLCVDYSAELPHIKRPGDIMLWEYRRELDDYKLITESLESVSDLYLLKLLHTVSDALPDNEELKSFIADCNGAISRSAIDYLINHKGLKDCMISLITTDIKTAYLRLTLGGELETKDKMRIKLEYRVGRYNDFICVYIKEDKADTYEFVFSAYYGEVNEEIAPLLYRKHYHFRTNRCYNDLSNSAISYLAQTLELKIFK